MAAASRLVFCLSSPIRSHPGGWLPSARFACLLRIATGSSSISRRAPYLARFAIGSSMRRNGPRQETPHDWLTVDERFKHTSSDCRSDRSPSLAPGAHWPCGISAAQLSISLTGGVSLSQSQSSGCLRLREKPCPDIRNFRPLGPPRPGDQVVGIAGIGRKSEGLAKPACE